jgi:mannosyltransferase
MSFPVLHLFLHRYLLFTLPAWTLLAAAIGFSLARRARSTLPMSLTALLVVAGVFYVGIPGQQAARRSPVLGEPDFRSAAAAVQSRQQSGDGVAFAGVGRNGRRAEYETRDASSRPRDLLVGRTSEQTGQFGAVECADPGRCAGDTRRIWLISASGNGQNPLGGMAETTPGLSQFGVRDDPGSGLRTLTRLSAEPEVLACARGSLRSRPAVRPLPCRRGRRRRHSPPAPARPATAAAR